MATRARSASAWPSSKPRTRWTTSSLEPTPHCWPGAARSTLARCASGEGAGRREMRLRALTCAVRKFAERRRTALMIVGTLGTAAVIVILLAGRRDEFQAAISRTALWLLAVAAVLQLVALLVRTEAWHLCIRAAGGKTERRVVYRASSLGVLGSFVQG